MNKQSNTYTIFYIIAMVVVVGAALAFTAMALKEKQQENINTDKMKQILAAVHLSPSEGKIQDDFNKYIVKQLVVNSDGDIMSNNAFDIDMAKESRITDAGQRRLPIFICNLLMEPPNTFYRFMGPVFGDRFGVISQSMMMGQAYMEHISHIMERLPVLVQK